MHAFMVTVATLSIFGFQKLSVILTFEKFTNSNLCKGVCEKTFALPIIVINKKIFFLMLHALIILLDFYCAPHLYINNSSTPVRCALCDPIAIGSKCSL